MTVCSSCGSLVARGDRQLEDLGKVASLVDIDSPLHVGCRGSYQNQPFEITGRLQFSHAGGGYWNEWYASFPQDRWGWLAEAEGQLYLTFSRRLGPESHIKSFEELKIGDVITVPRAGRFVVSEIGHADFHSAEGEIPYRFAPNEKLIYADLSGPAGAFATIDYSDGQPEVYFGHVVSLAELQIKPDDGFVSTVKQIAALQLSCPQCGGSLELRTPDQSQRVTCPFCDSLLDVEQGNLRFLAKLVHKVEPTIPLGAKGKWDGDEYVIIGFMQRTVRLDGRDYPWQEYLLYAPNVGFRWLVESDHHWSFVSALPPGDVTRISAGKVRWRNRYFRLFQDEPTRVAYVAGEFYWKVSADDTVATCDFIDPPDMLSCEIERRDPVSAGERSAAELHWSRGVYATPTDVKQAFSLQSLPRPVGIAPNQPFPCRDIYQWWAIFSALIMAIWLLPLGGPHRVVFDQMVAMPAATASAPGANTIFHGPLEIGARSNVRVTASTGIQNSYLDISGDLFNEETGLVASFDLPIEYYTGVTDGESWSEGSPRQSVYLSSLPAGKYTLRLEAQGEHAAAASRFQLTIEQGVRRLSTLLMALGALAVVPLITLIYQRWFETRRWDGRENAPWIGRRFESSDSDDGNDD